MKDMIPEFRMNVTDIIKNFKDCYNVKMKLLNSANYGVPIYSLDQNDIDKEIVYPEETHIINIKMGISKRSYR